jgi:hypothetical protein
MRRLVSARRVCADARWEVLERDLGAVRVEGDRALGVTKCLRGVVLMKVHE